MEVFECCDGLAGDDLNFAFNCKLNTMVSDCQEPEQCKLLLAQRQLAYDIVLPER